MFTFLFNYYIFISCYDFKKKKFINTMHVSDIAILYTFNTELSTLESWLEKSLLYLENLSKDNITDNVEKMEQKLEQIHLFSQEIDKTKPQIEALRLSANGILEKSELNFASLLNSKLEAVTYKWNTVVNETKSLNDKFESTLKKNDNVSIHNLHK